jgi:hypothetical protein
VVIQVTSHYNSSSTNSTPAMEIDDLIFLKVSIDRVDNRQCYVWRSWY